MTAPACINPLFAEMIERHTGLKISPVNGSEMNLPVPVLADVPEPRRHTPSRFAIDEARESTHKQEAGIPGSRGGQNFPGTGSEDLSGSQEIGLTSESTDRGSDAKLQSGGHVPSAQYLHYAILCMALLEENAILKQRLEDMARVEAEMFPR